MDRLLKIFRDIFPGPAIVAGEVEQEPRAVGVGQGGVGGPVAVGLGHEVLSLLFKDVA